MGLLKHAILPFFALFHSGLIFLVLTNRDGVPRELGFPDPDESVNDTVRHLLGALAAAHGALLMACLAGIFTENSHYRGIAILMELVLIGGDFLDAFWLGFPTGALGFFTTVAAVGALVHVNEPGIFTKDKTKAKSK